MLILLTAWLLSMTAAVVSWYLYDWMPGMLLSLIPFVCLYWWTLSTIPSKSNPQPKKRPNPRMVIYLLAASAPLTLLAGELLKSWQLGTYGVKTWGVVDGEEEGKYGRSIEYHYLVDGEARHSSYRTGLYKIGDTIEVTYSTQFPAMHVVTPPPR